MRDYFLFYRSFFEAISTLPPEMQAEIYPAIVAYALDGTPPQALSPLANSIFKLVKPFIDVNNKRRENGTKGGAPRGNQNARKNNRKTTEKQPTVELKNNRKTTKKQPNNIYYNNILSSTNVESNNYHNIKDVELNKFNIINNNKDCCFDVVDAAEKFFIEISKKEFITEACQALSLSEKEFLSHAKTIIAEWKISSPANFLPENTPKAHLVNQMRIKRDSPTESKAQSRFCDTVKRKQAEQAKKQKELEEEAEFKKSGGLKEFFRSKGLPEDASVLSLLSRPTEAEALAEFKTLNSN